MEVDDIIKRLAWAAKLYGGSRRKRECDQGSRARDWEIEDHDVVTEENPKELDQPLTTLKGSWTENGKFFGRRWK
jgi:hypothetical protein